MSHLSGLLSLFSKLCMQRALQCCCVRARINRGGAHHDACEGDRIAIVLNPWHAGALYDVAAIAQSLPGKGQVGLHVWQHRPKVHRLHEEDYTIHLLPYRMATRSSDMGIQDAEHSLCSYCIVVFPTSCNSVPRTALGSQEEQRIMSFGQLQEKRQESATQQAPANERW